MDDEQQTPHSEPGRTRQVLFAGGGSGGHVFPGLAVADALATRGWVVTWAGRPEGMERSLLERAGVPFVGLAAAPLVGQGLAGKAKALATLLGSGWRGRSLVRRLGADVVVGTGGYVCAPAVLGARLANVPSLLVEPNARAGAANRFLSRWATVAAVASGESAGDFTCPTETTGVPVRAEFFERPDRPTERPSSMLILGGSQGALQINELMPAVIERLAPALPSLRVVHQVGRVHLESVRADYGRRTLGSVEVELVDFVDDMPAAMNACGLLVSRAGAITLAEICAAGRPAVLIPLAQAAGHQIDNAARLVEADAAESLSAESVSVEPAAGLVESLLSDPDRLAAMGANARGLAHEDAAERIATMVEQLGEAA